MVFWCPRYRNQSRCSIWQQHVTVKFLHSLHSRQMTNSFVLEWMTIALRLWIWWNFGQCCEYFIWFLYLFTRPAILTAAKTKIILFLLEIRICMVICTMEFSLTGDTRHKNLANINLDRPASGVSLEAGNRQKSLPTLSEFTSYRHLLCLYFHSNY